MNNKENESENSHFLQYKVISYFIGYFVSAFLLLHIYTNYFSLGYFSKYSLFDNSIIEYFTIFTLYSIFFIVLKKDRLYFIPFLFLISYILLDVVSDMYDRYLDFSDLSNLPLLFDALLQSQGTIVYLVFLPIIVILFFIIKTKTMRLYTIATIITILLFIEPFLTHNYLASAYIPLYNKLSDKITYFWTPNKVNYDYAKTGRLSTFFYSGMLKQKNRHSIEQHRTNQKKELLKITSKLKGYHLKKRNVYIIGLESFSEPKQLKNLRYKYLNHDQNETYDVIEKSSSMTTSIFGGGTIQSEFEALCGVPALQKISAFEFTELIGAPTNCLPQILKGVGFDTVVSNSYKPQPSFEALTSVGFADINFPKEYFPNKKSYLSNKTKSHGEYAMFDTNFYNQNLKYIKKKYLDNNRTVFNYMFTVWGHAMHEMTALDRPVAIKIKNAKELGLSEHTVLAINQEYYRIKALQDIFDRIKKDDPTALVIAFSDHRPVLDGASKYKKYGLHTDVFHNFIVIMDNGKYIQYKQPFPLYALPDIILNRLSDGIYCQNHPCKIKTTRKTREKYLSDYYEIMANGMNIDSKRNSFILHPNAVYTFNNPEIPFVGFSQAEAEYRWTNAKEAKIIFKINNKNDFIQNIKLRLGTLGKQKIEIYLNDHLIFNQILNTQDSTLNIGFNKNYLNNGKINVLKFLLPNAHVPGNGDSRILAMQFKSMQIR